MVKIYTKKGDSGKTFLGNGKKVWKDNQRVKAYGSLDELNSWIGLLISQISPIGPIKVIKNPLLQIQSDLMLISSILAGIKVETCHGASLQKQTKFLESLIDNLKKDLPPLKNFILPGGTLLSSYFHIARSVCRRSEREVVTLSQKEKILPEILIYLNRLSDLLFILARWTNKKENGKEIIWKP